MHYLPIISETSAAADILKAIVEHLWILKIPQPVYPQSLKQLNSYEQIVKILIVHNYLISRKINFI